MEVKGGHGFKKKRCPAVSKVADKSRKMRMETQKEGKAGGREPLS